MQMRRGHRRALGAICAVAALAVFVMMTAFDFDSDVAFFAFGLVISALAATAWQMFGLPWLMVPPFGWRKRQ